MKKAQGKQAGPDAARGEPGERGARTNATVPGREANADSAGSPNNLPPGVPQNAFEEDMLPADGHGFVEAVHRKVDLVGAADVLLRSEDEKLKQKVLEQLLELAYGRYSAAVLAARINDEEIPSSWHVPRPKRD